MCIFDLTKFGRYEVQSKQLKLPFVVTGRPQRCNSVTVSPVSNAARGLVSDDRGLSLRFPRFIRTRPDKPPSNASTPQFLATMWKKQQGKGNTTSCPAADDGDLIDAVASDEEAGGTNSESSAL